jgi:hypothetical protein
MELRNWKIARSRRSEMIRMVKVDVGICREVTFPIEY